MRSLKLMFVCAAFLVLFPLGAKAENDRRGSKDLVNVLLYTEDMSHARSTEDSQFMAELESVRAEFVKNSKSVYIISSMDPEILGVFKHAYPCSPSEVWRDCFSRYAVRRFVEGRLVGNRLLLEQYDYGIDGRFTQAHHEVRLMLDDKKKFQSQITSILVCLLYDEQVVGKVMLEQACKSFSEMKVQQPVVSAQPMLPADEPKTEAMAPWKPPETEKPAAKNGFHLPFSLYWPSVALIGAVAVPALVLGICAVGIAVANAAISQGMYTSADSKASGAHLASDSPYRQKILEARNNDLAVSGGWGIMAAMFIPMGLVLGILAMGLTAYGTVK